MNTAVVISLVMLIVIIAVQIVMIARWSGKIDGYMAAITQRLTDVEAEVLRLRNWRDGADGTIQRHEGLLHDRRALVRRVADCPIIEGDTT